MAKQIRTRSTLVATDASQARFEKMLLAGVVAILVASHATAALFGYEYAKHEIRAAVTREFPNMLKGF